MHVLTISWALFYVAWLGVWFSNRTLDDIPRFTVEQVIELLRENSNSINNRRQRYTKRNKKIFYEEFFKTLINIRFLRQRYLQSY